MDDTGYSSKFWFSNDNGNIEDDNDDKMQKLNMTINMTVVILDKNVKKYKQKYVNNDET